MSLLVALLFAAEIAAAPASSPPEASAPPGAETPAVEKTPAETLVSLKAVYASTCGETGILYYSYADLCDGLRKQIRVYEAKVDRTAARVPPPPPKR